VKSDDSLAVHVSALEKSLNKLLKVMSNIESSIKDIDKSVTLIEKNIKGKQAKLDKVEQRQLKNEHLVPQAHNL
jgi:peptidoglycan hydrolase CwlO-like protein